MLRVVLGGYMTCVVCGQEHAPPLQVPGVGVEVGFDCIFDGVWKVAEEVIGGEGFEIVSQIVFIFCFLFFSLFVSLRRKSVRLHKNSVYDNC